MLTDISDPCISLVTLSLPSPVLARVAKFKKKTKHFFKKLPLFIVSGTHFGVRGKFKEVSSLCLQSRSQ